MQVDQLISELATTGAIDDEATADLNRLLEEWRAGNLDPQDESYIRALHARIVHGSVPEPDVDEPVGATLDGLTIAQWRERALKAEAELAKGDGGD